MMMRSAVKSAKNLCRPTSLDLLASRNIAGPSNLDERRRRLVEKYSIIEDPFQKTSNFEENWRSMNFASSSREFSKNVRDIRLVEGENMLVRNVRVSDRWFSLHEYPTGKFVRDLFDAETKGKKPMNAAFLKDGKKLAVHYENDMVVVWDVASGEVARTFKFARSGGLRQTHRAIFTGDKMLWCVGRSRLEVYDFNTGKQCARYECHQPIIGDIRFDGDLLALHLEGGPVQILDISDGTRREVHFLGDTTAPMGVTIGLVSELDQIFVKTGQNVHVHDVITGEHLGTWDHHRGPLPAWNYYHGRMFGIFDLNQVFIHRFNGHAWSNSLQTYDFPINPVGFINEHLFLTTTAEHNNPSNKSVFQLWDMDSGTVIRHIDRDWNRTIACTVSPTALDFVTADGNAENTTYHHWDFDC
ncbi:unnamed protein product [Bursaphelenchus okinawaensis]|uniref:Uncharacterized protein n=1 Tax=Bursaphelenchus okinawaensis TaxID=465554 RepID=A0A811KFH3_9BILA|nr:unnamed protein product [Bursaphelenchus okinawaensis]CAG9102162.1 unnamed protein product [Bursaphelenchus okinawaensis]